MSERPSTTATFLFTDIEGSTQLANRLRDRYADVLATHHELLQEVFSAHGGRVIDTQGDTFFVAFARARDAVAAAAEVQRTLAAHPWPEGVALRVRVGLHTGEADVAGDRYVGLSVHRAARISAVGHGGQILVSQSTAGLVEDDIDHLHGLSLRDLGERGLKDFARPIRIYQLDVEGLPADFPALAVPVPEPRRPWRRALLAAAALFAGLLVAAGLVLLGEDDAPPEIVANSLVRFDPDSLEPTDVIKVGSGPDLVVAAGSYVWMTHHVLRDNSGAPAGFGGLREAGDRTLTRVDTRSNEAVVVGGGLAPCGLTPDPSGDVWVANCFGDGRANVTRVDADTLAFTATWTLPDGLSDTFYRGLAYGGGSLWVSNPPFPTITQVDPRSGRSREIIRLVDPFGLAWSEGYGDLWMTNVFDGSVSKLHGARGALRTFRPVGSTPASVVVARDGVWVGDYAWPQVFRLNAQGSGSAQPVNLPSSAPYGGAVPPYLGVWMVAAGEGSVWATVPRDGALWRIDPSTNRATRTAVPRHPAGVAVGDDGIWVTIRGKLAG